MSPTPHLARHDKRTSQGTALCGRFGWKFASSPCQSKAKVNSRMPGSIALNRDNPSRDPTKFPRYSRAMDIQYSKLMPFQRVSIEIGCMTGVTGVNGKTGVIGVTRMTGVTGMSGMTGVTEVIGMSIVTSCPWLLIFTLMDASALRLRSLGVIRCQSPWHGHVPLA